MRDEQHDPGPDPSPAGRVRETLATAAQYVLLGGFAAVASGISAQGLTGFARTNMGLPPPWPYLLFLSLDGAAGVCAVLLMRRAARAESGLAPRLAVWGLVAASAIFNATHAPRRPAAPEAFALMPVIAATLFEFTLRELRARVAGRAGRTVAAISWLHPAEYARVKLMLAASPDLTAEGAARRVRADQAARRLYRLRRLLAARDQAPRPDSGLERRIRRAEHRAHTALTRARFADDPQTAAEILRQVQVLTLTPDLAALEYGTADAGLAALANLISGPPPAQEPPPRNTPAARPPARPALNGHETPALAASEPGPPPAVPAPTGPGAEPGAEADGDERLIEAAARILADSARDGTRLSQSALAARLRSQGYSIPNGRLRWLAAATGMTRHD
jgi:hypothetical protein